jgi:hypothetical protein
VTAAAVRPVEAALDPALAVGEALSEAALVTPLAVGEVFSYLGFHLKSLRAIVVS